MNKKAQSQIITTVLIILLVLAAIVIVWQVVNRTVQEGSKQIDTQAQCFGIVLEVVNTNPGTNTIFSIKRRGGGTLSTNPLAPSIIVTADDASVICNPWTPAGPTWDLDGTTATCTLPAAATRKVEATLRLGDGTVCTSSTASVDI